VHIFSRRKKEVQSELQLLPVQEKERYDIFAALAKALLLFILVYGALGGFLSAFEIEYNKGLCMCLLFLLAVILSTAYETGKRWLTNLLSLGLFGFYLYIAISNYWIINSGYYAIMNAMFQKARDYLDITGGIEYSTVVQDEYSTVTLFVLFLGMVGIILFNIQMQTKCDFVDIAVLTFTPYIVPFYLECRPSMIYMILLFTGYVTVAIIQSGNVRKHLSGQMRRVLPLALLCVVLVIQLFAWIIPETMYNRAISESKLKTDSRDKVSELARYGMSALFQRTSNGGGMSGGMLSKGGAVMPNYETDLVVRYTPYSYDAVYLKAFTGKDYTGSKWTQAKEDGSEDGRMEKTVQSHIDAYTENSAEQGRGVMEIEYVGADVGYEYRPYYTDYENVVRRGICFIYTYYPGGKMYGLHEMVDEAYLSVPEACYEAVESVCKEQGFTGDATQIALQIVDFYENNYSYTLRPGFYYGNPDYISHFLLESKKGYCSHFASSATMLFRYMGIPARYVEGYAFSYSDVVDDGELVENAEYSAYFDGYSAMGETALVELEIPDAYAHAWVEIYIDGAGWIVVDPTPASTEEDTTSFWDAFANLGNEGGVPDLADGDIGQYLENAMDGMSYVFVIAIVLGGAFLVVRCILKIRRERKLSERERVQLSYEKLLQSLKHKNKEHFKLRTVAQQINCMRQTYGLVITQEQEQALYQVYFAPEIEYDCEKLRSELIKLRRQLYMAQRDKNA